MVVEHSPKTTGPKEAADNKTDDVAVSVPKSVAEAVAQIERSQVESPTNDDFADLENRAKTF